jgi:hypothetical protein
MMLVASRFLRRNSARAETLITQCGTRPDKANEATDRTEDEYQNFDSRCGDTGDCDGRVRTNDNDAND